MKDLTELVFILDRSGSMSGLESDTIGGFNSLINKQKKEDGKAIISTVLFDYESKVIHNRVDLEKIKPMTEKDYMVRGSTALLDAIGNAINHISNVHKTMNEDELPEKTMFVITTDGMENSSKEYSYKMINNMIKHQEKHFGWEFLFLGANIDAIAEGSKLGFGADHSVTFRNDSVGTSLNYDVLSDAISDVRTNKKISKNWKKKIEKDFDERK